MWAAALSAGRGSVALAVRASFFRRGQVLGVVDCRRFEEEPDEAVVSWSVTCCRNGDDLTGRPGSRPERAGPEETTEATEHTEGIHRRLRLRMFD